MFERLDQIEAKYEELTQALASPDITNDSSKYQKTAKAHSEISETVEKYREYKDLKRGIAESRAVIADESDADMRAYAQEELDKLESRVRGVEERVPVIGWQLFEQPLRDDRERMREERWSDGATGGRVSEHDEERPRRDDREAVDEQHHRRVEGRRAQHL